jgi:uncharacterized glyoxalase superfamily protein PhnB
VPAKPIPDGYNTVSVHLIVENARDALEFYARAFGGETVEHIAGPGGKGTMHASMRIGSSTVMVADQNPAWAMKSPRDLGGSPASLHIYTRNADALYQRALEAGCTAITPLQDAFWGDRYGKVKDPFGYEWGIATRNDDLGGEEIARRAAEWFSKMGEQA